MDPVGDAIYQFRCGRHLSFVGSRFHLLADVIEDATGRRHNGIVTGSIDQNFDAWSGQQLVDTG